MSFTNYTIQSGSKLRSSFYMGALMDHLIFVTNMVRVFHIKIDLMTVKQLFDGPLSNLMTNKPLDLITV